MATITNGTVEYLLPDKAIMINRDVCMPMYQPSSLLIDGECVLFIVTPPC